MCLCKVAHCPEGSDGVIKVNDDQGAIECQLVRENNVFVNGCGIILEDAITSNHEFKSGDEPKPITLTAKTKNPTEKVLVIYLEDSERLRSRWEIKPVGRVFVRRTKTCRRTAHAFVKPSHFTKERITVYKVKPLDGLLGIEEIVIGLPPYSSNSSFKAVTNQVTFALIRKSVKRTDVRIPGRVVNAPNTNTILGFESLTHMEE